MNEAAEKIGFAAGAVMAVFLPLPIINLTMGDCFFEQGCGRYENLKLAAALVASFILAFCFGSVVFRLIALIARRHDK